MGYVFPANVSTISALTLFAAAIVVGALNVAHVVHKDLYVARGTRSSRTAVAHSVMLASFALSLLNGYNNLLVADSPANVVYDKDLHLSDGVFVTGVFLVLLDLQTFLPVMQQRMGYHQRWNKALKSLNIGLYVVDITGYLICTIVVERMGSNVAVVNAADSIRTVCVSSWTLYSPIMLISISIMVVRMVTSVKQKLVEAGNLNVLAPDAEGGGGVSPVQILDDIKRTALITAWVLVPTTTAVAATAALPYSVVLDGVATLYAAIFCSWLIFNLHCIRQIVLYSPSLSTPPASRKDLRGLAAVLYSNEFQETAADVASSDSKRGSVLAPIGVRTIGSHRSGSHGGSDPWLAKLETGPKSLGRPEVGISRSLSRNAASTNAEGKGYLGDEQTFPRSPRRLHEEAEDEDEDV